MLILAIATSVMAWFILLTVLRRLLGQPDLASKARVWVGVSMVLVASLFALASMFALAVVDRRFYDPQVFLVAFFLFLMLSFFAGAQCLRKAAK